jgi:hypothetical protein
LSTADASAVLRRIGNFSLNVSWSSGIHATRLLMQPAMEEIAMLPWV